METNKLYPIFLKAHRLNILLIGAGKTGTEKLRFLLKSSPDANIEILATKIGTEAQSLIEQFKCKITKDVFHPDHLTLRNIVIAATNNRKLNEEIYHLCRERKILVNVADNPDLCDFYLGGIVTKGHLKIAISTNGKSPTLAKRLRQLFEQEFPEDMNELLMNLEDFRKQLKGDFNFKLSALNELTKDLINKKL